MVVTRSHRFAILLADLYSVSLASDCARYVACATREESRSPLAFSAAASISIVLFAAAIKRDALGMAGTGPILRYSCRCAVTVHPPCFGLVIGGFGTALQAAMDGGLNLRGGASGEVATG